MSEGEAVNEYVTIHMCPPKRSGIMPCCGVPVFERRGDRMTLDPENVTCGIADFTAADRELHEGLTRDLCEFGEGPTMSKPREAH